MSAASGAQAQVSRLLTLVPFLHHHDQVRLADAAALLDATPQQVLNDLKVLFLCGLPGGMPDDLIDVDLDAIETDGAEPRADGVIRVSNADYLDRPLRLTPVEASAIILSLRLLRESASPQTAALVDGVVEKLQGAADVGAAADRVAVTPGEAPGPDRSELAARLEQAAYDARQVRLRYHVPSRDEVSDRRVDPRGVVREGAHAYLDAWCHRAGGPRLFRLDRITEVEVLDAAVETEPAAPRDLSTGPLVGDATTARTVTVHLAPPALWMTDYYDVTALRPLPDGGAEVDLVVADPRWLTRLLLRLAPHAAVVRPREFTDSFLSAARAARALYDERVDSMVPVQQRPEDGS
ncbi:WYL domain-containing protein [Nocardioides panacisoli]|uniref:helix-turn-helix transcriptional regulator n=1 Tax=Nocardioides panacisoli TaxID=627624 RepID=UPI001C632323|nr:WYL domain-containing protein [Nocardioides panacisoli]QYJ05059.1 WYL domain-containing protein [Nocardioides panacisoli]